MSPRFLGRWLRTRLFISYSQHDAVMARRLSDRLRDLGYDTFVADSDTPPGENFVGLILRQIRRADGILALLSPRRHLARGAMPSSIMRTPASYRWCP